LVTGVTDGTRPALLFAAAVVFMGTLPRCSSRPWPPTPVSDAEITVDELAAFEPMVPDPDLLDTTVANNAEAPLAPPPERRPDLLQRQSMTGFEIPGLKFPEARAGGTVPGGCRISWVIASCADEAARSRWSARPTVRRVSGSHPTVRSSRRG
jgi:hypothetical protein